MQAQFSALIIIALGYYLHTLHIIVPCLCWRTPRIFYVIIISCFVTAWINKGIFAGTFSLTKLDRQLNQVHELNKPFFEMETVSLISIEISIFIQWILDSWIPIGGLAWPSTSLIFSGDPKQVRLIAFILWFFHC